VKGAPLNLDRGSRDPGMRNQIFRYDGTKDNVAVKTAVGCTENSNSEVINTVAKFREQTDKSFSSSASASGSMFGVSVGFEFSASASSSAVRDQIKNKKGALAITTMICSVRSVSVGNWLTGFPPFTTSFKNLVESLAKVDADNSGQKLRAFKTMIKHFGTHYLAKSTLGSRITVTSFLTEEATEQMSQDKIEGCVSSSVNAEYFGAKASVSAKGCGSKDGSKFNSNKKMVEKVVKTSYGTFVRNSEEFSEKSALDSMPIKFQLASLVNLFDADILKDNDILTPEETSTKILSWLKPMFGDLKKYYCEAFSWELPDCGKLARKGCGYTDNCALGEGCIDLDTNKGTFKCVAKCPWGKGKGRGGFDATYVGRQTGVECVAECYRRSQIKGNEVINGARVKKNGQPGCWCENGMVKSSKKWDGFKSCVFKKAEEYPLALWHPSMKTTFDAKCHFIAPMALDRDIATHSVTKDKWWMAELKKPAIVTTAKVHLSEWAKNQGLYKGAKIRVWFDNKWNDCETITSKNTKKNVATVRCSYLKKASKIRLTTQDTLYLHEFFAFGLAE